MPNAPPPVGPIRAACTQVAFRPDWNRHKKAAPFKRNDQMLEALPVGLVVFPGTGIQDNLADKARKMGIPLWDFPKASVKVSVRTSLWLLQPLHREGSGKKVVPFPMLRRRLR